MAALENAPKKVLGFYTLSATGINFSSLPEGWQKKLPRYPIPMARIGRLAVDKSAQNQGLGKHLLMDALYRCVALAENIGIFGVLVDAKHDQAKQFYSKYGFCNLTHSPLTLILPLSHIVGALSEEKTLVFAEDQGLSLES